MVKYPVYVSNICEYPLIQLLIIYISSLSMISFMWFWPSVVSWMIFIHNFFAYSISCVCNDPAKLLTIQSCLNCKTHPAILNKFLYIYWFLNLLVMLVMKWLWFLSMVAVVTITFSVIFNDSAYVSLVLITIGCVGQSFSYPDLVL